MKVASERILGIEIGGTKLQLGVGTVAGPPLEALERLTVCREHGASGILDQILEAGRRLVQQHRVTRIGIGFGGPVDRFSGHVFKSHQVQGWEGLPLGAWCNENLGLPAVLGNDCDCAALAEARYGAGRGRRCVFYVTVGTGIGGGLVVDGRLHGEGRAAVAEIGHLRPGLGATDAAQTVESLASGLALEASARRCLREESEAEGAAALRVRCGENIAGLTVRHLGLEAQAGNPLALRLLDEGIEALGWAVAQVITLVAPDVVVVGGGVSLLGEQLFFQPLRERVEQYVFPPLRGACPVVAAALGEEVVVHGAVALAADIAEGS